MKSTTKPKSVNILGVEYTITYVDKPSEVDIFKRESFWGQIDYWTRTIRIFDDGKRPYEDIFEIILHETLHGIENALKLKAFDDKVNSCGHDELDILALALTDVLFRNGWIKQ
jgi:hypothetical protein